MITSATLPEIGKKYLDEIHRQEELALRQGTAVTQPLDPRTPGRRYDIRDIPERGG
jgi:hypothetical protein